MAQFMQTTEELDDCFVKTAANIMKFYADEKKQEEMLNQLRDILKDNCVQSTKIEAADDVKDQLTNMLELQPESNAKNIVKEYKKAISQIKIDPSENNRLLQYDRQVDDLRRLNQAASNTGSDNMDLDVQLTSQDVNVIDPISKTRIIDPVRNAVCGHVYDRANLVAMLQLNNKTRCPVVGCSSKDYIDLNQCRTDIVTKLYLEKNPA